MGCCLYGPTNTPGNTNSVTESGVKSEIAHSECKKLKLLLLGTSQSGKSTIIKQLEKINDNSVVRRSSVLTQNPPSYIIDTIISDMKTLCQHPQTYLHRKHEYLRAEILALNPPYQLTSGVIYKIETLYKDDGIQETLQKRDEFGLSICDNIEYFFNKIEQIASDSYIASFEDSVRINRQTIGYSETQFVKRVDNFGEFTFSIPDIGGVRTERRKWFNPKLLLDPELNSIIYVTAINEYNQVLFEDNTTNRLIESINSLKEMLTLIAEYGADEYFENKSFILLFNKYDLFKKKFKIFPISDTFNDFPDDMCPINETDVLQFIANKFLNVFEKCNINLKNPLRIIRTNAIDTDNICEMFEKIAPGMVMNYTGAKFRNMMEQEKRLNHFNIDTESNKMNGGFAVPLILQKQQNSTPAQNNEIFKTKNPLTLQSETHSLPALNNSKVLKKRNDIKIMFKDI